MTKWIAAALVLAVGCKGSSGSDARGKWLGAKLVPVDSEHKGVKLHLELPDGLPQNKESLVGPDWRTPSITDPGPRVSLGVAERNYKSPDDLARNVEPDAKRLDLVEIAKTTLPGGGLQYVSATNGNRHLDVTNWIPLADGRGVQATCHWYAGSGGEDRKQPDAELVAWLTKICATVRAN